MAELIEQVDLESTRCGAPAQDSGEDAVALARLKKTASQAGIEFISGRQRHIGTRRVREVIDNLYHDLLARGVTFLLGTTVREILHTRKGFQLVTSAEPIDACRVVAALGRSAPTGCASRHDPWASARHSARSMSASVPSSRPSYTTRLWRSCMTQSFVCAQRPRR